MQCSVLKFCPNICFFLSPTSEEWNGRSNVWQLDYYGLLIKVSSKQTTGPLSWVNAQTTAPNKDSFDVRGLKTPPLHLEHTLNTSWLLTFNRGKIVKKFKFHKFCSIKILYFLFFVWIGLIFATLAISFGSSLKGSRTRSMVTINQSIRVNFFVIGSSWPDPASNIIQKNQMKWKKNKTLQNILFSRMNSVFIIHYVNWLF